MFIKLLNKYIKITNGSPTPYSIVQLRRENPQVSFPKDIPESTLTEYNVYPLQLTEKPEVDHTKNVTEGTPVRQKARNPDGTFVADNPETPENEAWEWVQVWEVTPASTDEIAEREAEKASEVRSNRNQLLTECDWTQVLDAPVDQTAWAVYRQALRDITAQPGFPWEVEYPQAPTNN